MVRITKQILQYISDQKKKAKQMYCVKNLKQEVAAQVKGLNAIPGLGTILVGDDPASHSYVGAKIRDCEEVGGEGGGDPLPEPGGGGDGTGAKEKTEP